MLSGGAGVTDQLGFDFGASGTEDQKEPTLPGLVQSLAAVAAAHRFDRKLVIARTRGEGRELLRQLAIQRGSWVGFEVTTLLPLAVELAAPDLSRERLRVLDEFGQQAIVDQAIDAVLLGGQRGPLSHMAEGVGFRATLRNAVQTLRLGGISAARVWDTHLDDLAKKDAVGGVLARYEALLEGDGLVDQAGVLSRALRSVRTAHGSGVEGVEIICLVPGLGLRGLSGRLVRALLKKGARILETDPVEGLSPPDSVLWAASAPHTPLSYLHAPARSPADRPRLELFSASGVTEELREVLRRVMAMGLQWDEVELVTPDPTVYGSALHALAGSLDIPVSYGVGLPVERTRPGRAVAAYFRWIEGGFGADVIRTLLAAGDLVPPKQKDWVSPARLARRLRGLRIGWGRDRYMRLVEAALASVGDLRQGRNESAEGFERRTDDARRELGALRSILGPVLNGTPPVPESLDEGGARVSPAALARGLRTFLRRVRTPDAVDRTAMERLERQLDRVAATLDRPVTYRGAASILRGHLELRVPAPRVEGRAPWSSAGGHLYLTDLEHGGMTGRRATFVVGLDANRFPGSGIQDPLLLDNERWILARGELPRSSDRQREAGFKVAALLARLRGAVTLSYSAWDPAEARVIPPALHLLLAYRLKTGDEKSSFEDLRAHLGLAAGAVPRTGSRLDARDVWLGSLARDGRLLAGEDVVRAGHPDLEAGERARDAQALPDPNVYHGLLRPRPDALDPRRNPDRILSASKLETLGRCQRKYLFQSVLGIWIPDDPELDPERWLNPLHKGDLLHRVYERVLDRARDRDVGRGGLSALSLEVLEEEATRKLDEVPAPSHVVYRREMEGLRDDVRAFARMASERLDRWVATELRFGLEGDPPVPVEVGGGTIRLRGAIDRIDRTDDGLVVVDYKTGKVRDYEPRTGAFNGGRRLQNWLYSQVAEARLGEPVEGMEYAFPTEKGQNEVRTYTPLEMASGGELVGLLLDTVADGHCFPTDTPGDCTYCDYRALCGVRESRDGLDSPLAEWSKEAMAMNPPLLRLRRAREWEG